MPSPSGIRERDFARNEATYDNGVWLRQGKKPLYLNPRMASSLSVVHRVPEASSHEPPRPVEGAAASYYNEAADGRDDDASSIVESASSQDAQAPKQKTERRFTRSKSAFWSVKSKVEASETSQKVRIRHIFSRAKTRIQSWKSKQRRRNSQSPEVKHDPEPDRTITRRHSIGHQPYAFHSIEDHNAELRRRGHCETCKCIASNSTINTLGSEISYVPREQAYWHPGKHWGITNIPGRWEKRTVMVPILCPAASMPTTPMPTFAASEVPRGRPTTIPPRSGRPSGERSARASPERGRSRRKLAGTQAPPGGALPKQRATFDTTANDRSPVHRRKSSKRAGKQPVGAPQRSRHAVDATDASEDTVDQPLPTNLKSRYNTRHGLHRQSSNSLRAPRFDAGKHNLSFAGADYPSSVRSSHI